MLALAIVAGLCHTSSLLGQAGAKRLSINPSAGAVADRNPDEDSDTIQERDRLYLRRHGDNGRIDPELRLRLVREEYERWEMERFLNYWLKVEGTNWTSLGPTNGAGRMTAVAPHPTTAGTLYVGAAGGGVWKTTDSGSSWIPLTDGINDLSVGAVALAPSSPTTVYLGTGEGGFAIDFIPGIGLLKSIDGGTTWTFPPSVVATQFYRISVHPTNSQELVVGTNQGGLRSTDGGTTWTTVISNGVYGDVTDIVRHPANDQVLYGATWDRFAWCARPGSSCSVFSPRVLKSTDSGATWSEKSFGLPVSTASQRVNRMSIAISSSNPLVLYAATAIFDASTGDEISHIYKTLDGGDSWTELVSLASNTNYFISHYMASQAWYDNTIVVAPTGSNVVIAGGTYYVRSTNGGATWDLPSFTGGSIHVDAHDLRYQGTTLYIANDGGMWSTSDNGSTSANLNTGLVTRQFYALANDPVNRNRIFAGAQDNGTNRRADAGGTLWSVDIPADGFECAVNPDAPSFAYGTTQFANIFRTKAAGTGSFAIISPPYLSNETGRPFLSILTIDPVTPSTLYTGTSRLWRTTTGGDSWTPLPTTTTDGSAWSTASIGAIAVSPSNPQILMVSKSNAIFRSVDGGNTWTKTSNGLPGLFINNVAIDPKNSSTAYTAMAGTSGNHVYMTVDGGASWAARGSGLPSFSAQVVRVDPTDSNVLYCGTDVGVYRSLDQGATWVKFGTGLPAVSVQDVRILEDASILRVATHGRGVWELQVPSTGNTPPTAVISSPASPLTVAKGTSIIFQGSVADPDPGDSASGLWTFPDNWQTVATGSGASSVAHVFNSAGVFPVTLTSRDTRGARGSSSVTIGVRESFDDCAAPIVIPSNGPFPWSLNVNNEAATTQVSDPIPACAYNTSGVFRSLWFQFTPTVSGFYTFSTCGSAVDTVLSLWTGSACGPYAPLAGGCNDDSTDPGCPGNFPSQLTVSLTAGQTVRLQVSTNFTGDTGSFTLTVTASSALGPDLSIGKSHSGNFAVGNNGVYSLLVTNVGSAASSGNITVTDTLPAGLSLVSGAGAGWSCTALAQVVNCVNTSPLAPGATSTITLTVAVMPAAVGIVINTVTLSNSSDINAANNTASDPTIVNPAAGPATNFYTVAPCRVADTRNASGPLGGPALAANGDRTFVIAGQCGVPLTARAVSLNITITQPAADGDLRLYPGGTALPLVSNINYRAGRTRANNAIVTLGAAGDIAVRCDQVFGTVHFIIDVNGYFQ